MSINTVRESADVVMTGTDTASVEEWLVRRKEGIGGSDAAAACGLSPWDSMYSLWEMKRGNLPSKDDTEAMKWGRRLERAMGEGFAEDTGIPVVRYPVMLRSKIWPWAQVNLDFLTADGESVVEVKNVGLWQLQEWEDGRVPGHIMLQGMHELAVTGLGHLWFAALVGGQNPRYIEVQRNDAVIEALMEQEKAFWDLVEANTPPAVDGSDATTQALKDRYANPEPGSMVEVDEAMMGDLLLRRSVLKVDAAYTKSELDVVENQIKAILGDHEIGTVDGRPAVTWKKSEPERIDSDKLRAEYPEVAKVVSYKKPERRLHIPKNSPLK